MDEWCAWDHDYRCDVCEMTFDGSEMVVWKSEDSRRRVVVEVDVDEVRKMWRWENNRVVKPERVCRGCGRRCKGDAGLRVHLRSCEVGDWDKECGDCITVVK